MLENFKSIFIGLVYKLVNILDLTSPFRVIVFVIDILIVTLIFYYIYKFVKKTRASQIVKGVLFLILLFVVANFFNMIVLKFLLNNFMTYGVLMAIVIFQPELRNVFERLGRSKIVDVFDMDDNILVKHSISEIVKAVEIISLKKIGAIIVLQRDSKISDVVKEGISLGANVSSEIIQNIFMPRTPLHDGAVVIDKTQILAAKCILPLASEVAVEKSLGTRHRAAVGISEISDALVIVVSEETGIISLAEEGNLTRNLTSERLKELLYAKMDKTSTGVVLKSISSRKNAE